MTLLFFIIGCVLGSLLTAGFIFFSSIEGNLRIDSSDPEESPYLFLELNTDVNKIMKKKQIKLNVKMENYVS